METTRLLTDDELEKLTEMAEALNAIAGSCLAGMPDSLSEQVVRLREMVDRGENIDEIRELAEDLNAVQLLDWVEAIEDGDLIIDRLVLKLAEGSEDNDDDDDEPKGA